MAFAKVLVEVYTHPRFIHAGYDGSGYWMHALAYLRHHESADGFLADRVVHIPLGGTRAKCRKLCEKLVAAGLFERVEGGYFLLRYAQNNDTKEVIHDNRVAARQRQSGLQRGKPSRPSESSSPDDPPGVLHGERAPSPSTASLPLRQAGEICTSLSTSLSSLSLKGEGESEGTGPPTAPVAVADGPRRELPPSERRLSGSLWLQAFTEGISQQTGRPCTVGKYFLETLERIVTHHAPGRAAPAACAWIRDQAIAFASQWDGKNPPKGLTPDGLERWLNEGRHPPFQKPGRIVQREDASWKAEDFTERDVTFLEFRKTPKGDA
jgi:hypothetical protein